MKRVRQVKEKGKEKGREKGEENTANVEYNEEKELER